MSDNGTAVTNDRFEQGLTYGAYVDQINVNRDRFEQCKSSASEVMGDDDAEFFKAAVANGLSKVLVLGEDWCPDVYRGMPVMARLAEASGMDIRIFPRDQHLDIMDEFLKDNGINPQAVAGHSLGEFSALVSAGVISFEDGLQIVNVRSQAMTRASNINPGMMAAVIGASEKQLKLI